MNSFGIGLEVTARTERGVEAELGVEAGGGVAAGELAPATAATTAAAMALWEWPLLDLRCHACDDAGSCGRGWTSARAWVCG